MKLIERHVHSSTGVVSHVYAKHDGFRVHRRYPSVQAESDAPNCYEELQGAEWVSVGGTDKPVVPAEDMATGSKGKK